MGMEYRSVDVRAAEDAEGVLTGYAAVFDTVADLGWRKERISRAAFDKTLNGDADVVFLTGHNYETLPLARRSAHTLKLSTDSTGLKFDAQLDLEQRDAADLYRKVKRGDVRSMSIGFSIDRQSQVGEGLWQIDSANLQEISAVAIPAYESTSVAARGGHAKTGLRPQNDPAPYLDNRTTPERREYDQLVQRASLTRAIDSLTRTGHLNGAEAELQAAAGCTAEYRLPWALLDGQTRAAVNTNSAADVQEAPILQRVFANTATDFMRVRRVMVPAQASEHAVITTGATVSVATAGTATTESSPVLGVTTLRPATVRAVVRYRKTDAAVLAQLDDALRMDLRSAIGEALDEVVVDGLFSIGNNPTAATTSLTYAQAIGLATNGVDGRYATDVNQVRLLVGAATYRFLATLFTTGSRGAGDNSLTWLKDMTAGLMVSAHAPAVASDAQELVRRKGAHGGALLAVWEGFDLTRDPYTAANQGEILITAEARYQYATLRAAEFDRLSVKPS